MYGKGTPRTGRAHNRSKPITPEISVTALWRAVQVCAVMMAALLLSACSGSSPFVSADPQPAAPVQVRPKQMRATTARDILAEWGTFGIERKSFKRAKTPLAPRTYDAPSDYAPSIDEIMANAVCHSCEQKPYHQMVVNASNQHGVPASLIHAVIQKESGYNPRATSKRRARGLMQITPETGRFVGVRDSRNLYDPQTNISAGAAYLKYLMSFHDTVDEVLAAYNSGPGNVRKYNGVPPFKETRRYVHDVKKYYASTSRH